MRTLFRLKCKQVVPPESGRTCKHKNDPPIVQQLKRMYYLYIYVNM